MATGCPRNARPAVLSLANFALPPNKHYTCSPARGFFHAPGTTRTRDSRDNNGLKTNQTLKNHHTRKRRSTRASGYKVVKSNG